MARTTDVLPSTTDHEHHSGYEYVDYDSWYIKTLRIVGSIVIPTVGVFGNLLVIISVNTGLVKQTAPHILIANLATADFLFSLQNIIVMPPVLILGR